MQNADEECSEDARGLTGMACDDEAGEIDEAKPVDGEDQEDDGDAYEVVRNGMGFKPSMQAAAACFDLQGL